jgi:hypothetical protein
MCFRLVLLGFDLITSILVERSELVEEERPLGEAFSKRKLTSAGPIRERRYATGQRNREPHLSEAGWHRRNWICGSSGNFPDKRIFRYGDQIQAARAH